MSAEMWCILTVMNGVAEAPILTESVKYIH